MFKKLFIVIAFIVLVGIVFLFFSEKGIIPGREDIGGNPTGKEIYTDAKYNFSFEYPRGINISAVPQEPTDCDPQLTDCLDENKQGERIVAQSADMKQNFQITIAFFDEPGPLTKERILQDIPDMVINNPQNVTITKNKIDALSFGSKTDGVSETNEIWFIYNNNLYQISVSTGTDQLVGEILTTMEFK